MITGNRKHLFVQKHGRNTPLTMQDDTLGISVCGVRSKQMNQFLTTRTAIMKLQFGQEKCEKMHIGKTYNSDICPEMSVDSWKEKLIGNEMKEKEIQVIYVGEKVMKQVSEKKYLGDVISSDRKNEANIKERTNKAIGNVNKTVASLNERPYGRYYFKAYKLMGEGLLLGGMLTNSESWINMTKRNIEELEKPDTILQRKVLSTSGNPCKSFMMLELGLIPIRYVLMQKRLQFLHYLLKQDKESMLSKVFRILHTDSRKGDFIDLSNKDKTELEIIMTNDEIGAMSKWQWKKLVKQKTNLSAFTFLNEDNKTKEKTNHIHFKKN